MSSQVSTWETGMRPLKKASRYSLWLMPTGEVRQRLAAAILDLSREYAVPAFKPHVTLAGGIVGPAREVVEDGGVGQANPTFYHSPYRGRFP